MEKGDSVLSDGGFLQRGDAPAQAVIHANAQAMALRKAAETQEELGKINERVEKTLSSYQLADTIEQPISGADIVSIKESYIKDQEATLELVDDLTQLVIILSDPIAKKKYQQQVTIFIVGYENLCGNRVKLLHQLHDFFTQNSKDDDAYDIEYPDFDIEEVGKNVRNALDKAEMAHEKLDVLSKEVVKVLDSVNPKEAKSRKKKLEKAIIQSKDDILHLTEKLTNVQKDLEASDGKLSQLYKTLEGKQMEIEKLKGHVEMGKKKTQELDELKVEMEQKNTQLMKLRQDYDKMKLLLAHAEDKHEHVSNKQKESREAQQRMKSDLEERLKDQQQKVVEIRQAMETQHDSEMKDLRNLYENDMNEMKQKYEDEVKSLKDKLAIIEKQRDDAEREKSELQRFSTSFFNEDSGDRVRSGSKLSLKSSANAIRLATKKSQAGMSTLATDSNPGTPRKALKTDGTIGSFKSTPSSDTIKTPAERQPTELPPFPGFPTTTTTTTPMLPGSPAAPTPATPAIPSTSAVTAPSSTSLPASLPVSRDQSEVTLSSPEKSFGSRGKKRTGKFTKQKSNLTKRPSKPSLINENEVAIIEMIDESIQTDVLVPEKSKEQIEAETSMRRVSLSFIPEEEIKDFDVNDKDVNWDDYPIEELPARFAHYRKTFEKQREDMKLELLELKQKYNNKVQALKGMMDLRNNWNSERDELIKQLETGKLLKDEAEREADITMLQLEELMAEQEEMRLELKLKSEALIEVQTMTSPMIQMDSTSNSRQTTMVSKVNQAENADQLSRPTTMPTIITSDEHSIEVLHSNEADVLSATEITDRIMSARARKRLVNSALKNHPVAHEVLRCYKSLLDFKNCISDVLNKEELEEEAVMLDECEVVPLEEGEHLAVLENISNIRTSSSEIFDCMKEIIPALISSEDILFTTLNLDDDHDDEKSTKSPDITTTKRKSVHETSANETEVLKEEQEVKSSNESSKDKVEDKGQTEVKPDVENNEIQTLKEPRKSIHELQVSSDESDRKLTKRRLSSREGRKQLISDYKQLIDKHQKLTEEFENIKRNIKTKNSTYEQQLTQNANVMEEMKNVIDELKKQLQSYEVTHPLTVKASQIQSPDFMFTRLDMEHNARALKRGLQNGRISYEGYNELCSKMENYVSIPIKRFGRLARKYLHYCRMKEVEQAIRTSKSLDDKVYDLLDKMEDFQEKRTIRWEKRMEKLTNEREEIAKLLVKTLEMIEHETGIFLIKPIMSVPSRHRVGSGYVVSRRIKSAEPEMERDQSSGFLAPHSTPSPNLAKLSKSKLESSTSIQSMKKLDNGSLDMNVKSMIQDDSQNETVWKVNSSLSSRIPNSSFKQDLPRILELDLNRSMFTNNHISAKIPSDISSDVGPLQSNVLSYVTVTRPTGGIPKKLSARFDSSLAASEGGPPPSPYDEPVYRKMSPQHAPLPPIRSSISDGNDDGRSVSTYLSDAERHFSPILAQMSR